MSALGIAFVAAVVGAVVYGFALALRGMFADSPAYMEGEGKVGRMDERIKRKAA